MQEDLHMTDTIWSLGISMFYVGYIISQIPANIIIAKGSPRILLPSCMLAWSIVTICMPAVTAGWGFCLCRFIIGFVEGPFVPAVSLMTSSWYTKHESPMRMGIWHAGNTISQALSGLLAAAILGNMEGIGGLRAWKWFLLIEGAASILVALASFWFIPNFPDSTGTYFITEEEAEMAQYRQCVSAGGISEDDAGDMWAGFWMVSFTIKLWYETITDFATTVYEGSFRASICGYPLRFDHCAVLQGLLPLCKWNRLCLPFFANKITRLLLLSASQATPPTSFRLLHQSLPSSS
jgi:MFS family permease